MTHRSADRVCETTTTTGTSNLTLGGAVAGYQTFGQEGFANLDTTYAVIEAVDANGIPTGAWELSYIIWNAGVIARFPIRSSNADAAVNFAAGTKFVYSVNPAMLTPWGEISPAQLTANTHNWAPTEHMRASLIRFSTDASRDITGIAITQYMPGRILYLHNVGAFNAVLRDENASSTALNRFALSGDLTITPDMVAAVQWDDVTQRWRSLVPSSQTIIDLTEDAAPDISADFLIFWDTSTGLTKRVTLRDLRTQILAAGSATAGSWPILGSGTILTAAVKGAFEHDTNCLYFTTDVGNRGYVPVKHFIRANATRTLPNDTNLNAIFNSPANGRLTLETGTYVFEMVVGITAMSATTGNALLNVRGAGTATINDWLYSIVGKDGALSGVSTLTGGMPVTEATPASMHTGGAGTEMWWVTQGTFTVTAAGTIIPSVDLATASAAVVAIGSYFMCERVGDVNVVSVGQWD